MPRSVSSCLRHAARDKRISRSAHFKLGSSLCTRRSSRTSPAPRVSEPERHFLPHVFRLIRSDEPFERRVGRRIAVHAIAVMAPSVIRLLASGSVVASDSSRRCCRPAGRSRATGRPSAGVEAAVFGKHAHLVYFSPATL